MSALRIIIVLIELLCFGACVSIGIAAFMFHKSRLMESAFIVAVVWAILLGITFWITLAIWIPAGDFR